MRRLTKDDLKNFIYVTFIYINLFGFRLAGASAPVADAKDLIRENEVLVCFKDFRISIESEITEEGLSRDSYNCIYAIDKNTFLHLLLPQRDLAFYTYMPNHVRVVVSMSPGQIYFIDANGTVRFGDARFAIDKIALTNALRRLEVKGLPR